jgi:hypothetical protein
MSRRTKSPASSARAAWARSKRRGATAAPGAREEGGSFDPDVRTAALVSDGADGLPPHAAQTSAAATAAMQSLDIRSFVVGALARERLTELKLTARRERVGGRLRLAYWVAQVCHADAPDHHRVAEDD